MKLFIRIILYVSAVVLISCNSKNEPISDLQDLTTDLETNSKNYSGNDWEKSYNNFEEIDSQLTQYTYSDEELKEIGRLKGKCAAYFMRSYIKQIQDEVRDFSKEMDGAAEGFEDALNSNDETNSENN